MFPKIIQELVEIFAQFPGVGKRTALRFVFHLKKMKTDEFEKFLNKCQELNRLKFCKFCFNIFEGEKDLCPVCSDAQRNRKTILIVEKEVDFETIENTKKYNGLYFILGKTYNPLKEEETQEEEMRIPQLIERIKNPSAFGINTILKEIIIGTNNTREGEQTFQFLEKKLKPLNIKITRLARGLSTGGEIEYADEQTIVCALENRKEV